MARNILLALCLLGAFASFVSATQPNPPPDCWQYSSCSNCTTAPSGQCGWDPSNSVCREGGPSGPKSSFDWSGQWWWLSAQCCAANTHCTDCTTSNGYCGWDVNQGKCMRGNYWGPAVGQAQSWVAESDACPSQCQQSSDCSSCIETSGCVWVENVRQCVSGNSNGPFRNQAVVEGLGQQGSAVVWYSNSCPSNWGLRWSTNSYSLWCIAGSVGFTFLLATAAMGRRRRRLLREQRLRMGGYAAQPQTQQAQPQAAVGAPLLSQGAPDIQQGYPAQPIYGQPAPMPYYGATPEEYTESKPIY